MSQLPVPQPCEMSHVADFVGLYRHGVIRHGLSDSNIASFCLSSPERFPPPELHFLLDQKRGIGRRSPSRSSLACMAGPSWASHRGGLRQRSGPHRGHDDCRTWPLRRSPGSLRYCLVFGRNQVCRRGGSAHPDYVSLGRARIFGLIPAGKFLPPRISDLVMSAFGPYEVSLPRIGCRSLDVEVAWSRIEGHLAPRREQSPWELYQGGIARFGPRNDRVAQLARAITRNDNDALVRLCSARLEASRSGPPRALIVVRDVEHGITLASRMAGWPLMASFHVNLEGLSEFQKAVYDRHRHWPVQGPSAICTEPVFGLFDLASYDAVIWAAGGVGPPMLCHTALTYRGAEPRRLLWIDFDDHHSGALRRQTARRRKAYDEEGWYPVDTIPMMMRMHQFWIPDRRQTHELLDRTLRENATFPAGDISRAGASCSFAGG